MHYLTAVLVLAVGIEHCYRLVGQFEGYLPCILADAVVFADDVPHVQEVLVIDTSHVDTTGADARWTNHDVHSVAQGLLHDGPIDGTQILRQSCTTEVLYVGLAVARLVAVVRGVVVCPTRVEVKAEHITVRAQFGVGNAVKDLVEVVYACGDAGIVRAATPAVVVEVGTRGVHDTMKYHLVTFVILQPLAVYMERWHLIQLVCCTMSRERWQRHQPDETQR